MPESKPGTARVAFIVLAAAALLVLLLVLFVPLGGRSPAASPGAAAASPPASPGAADAVIVAGHPLAGRPAPDIALTSLDGQAVRLSELRGRPVLLNFWATWCLPCRDEFPLMVEAYREHADDGLQILGIVHQDSADGARAYAAKMGATWPILLDPQDEAWKAYLGVGLPMSFFVDAEGIVREFSLGGFTRDGLTSQLKTVLTEASPGPGQGS